MRIKANSHQFSVTAVVMVVALIALPMQAGASRSPHTYKNIVAPNAGSSKTSNDLHSVSCPTSKFCVAVGTAPTSHSGSLIESWNGTKWVVVAAPKPTVAGSDSLSGVSCTSASFCVAVGSIVAPGFTTTYTLIETWNGHVWSVSTSPDGLLPDELNAVSCPTTLFCVAVGSQHNGGTLIEQFNGSSWTVTTNPDEGLGSSSIAGVSCTSASFCAAAGGSSNGSLVEMWNGTVWSLATLPSSIASFANDLQGVSCTSTTFCAAAGNYISSTREQMTLVVTWNGFAWRLISSPTPSGSGFGAEVWGISCAKSTSCSLVGYEASWIVAFAEKWNGHSWSLDSAAQPAQTSFLFGVSCFSATLCQAVGYYDKTGTGPHRALIEKGP